MTGLSSRIGLALATGFLVSGPAKAERLEKPHQFVPGTVISSQQMNENFDVLYDALNRILNTPPVIGQNPINASSWATETLALPIEDAEGDPITVELLGGSPNLPHGISGSTSIDSVAGTVTYTPVSAVFGATDNDGPHGFVYISASDGQKSSSGVVRIAYPRDAVPGFTAPAVGFTYQGPVKGDTSLFKDSYTKAGAAMGEDGPRFQYGWGCSGPACAEGPTIAGTVQHINETLGVTEGQPKSISGSLTPLAPAGGQERAEITIASYPGALVDTAPLQAEAHDGATVIINLDGNVPPGDITVTPNIASFSPPAGGTAVRTVRIVIHHADATKAVDELLTQEKTYSLTESGYHQIMITAQSLVRN